MPMEQLSGAFRPARVTAVSQTGVAEGKSIETRRVFEPERAKICLVTLLMLGWHLTEDRRASRRP